MASTNSHIPNSLGFSKPPKETRVVVAMSGGVDSSVVAALMHEEGYDVVGITLQLYDHGQAIQKKGACCAGQDIYDARMVADRLGIPHYVLDYESVFSQAVMEDFADSYMRGETPIPCVRCNQKVKFRDLLTTAKDLGADALLTGHYVQRHTGDQGAELHAGADPRRDQSYFLFTTTKDQLDYLRFPLGHMQKDETRRHAERFGLTVADKPDSQDICFVPNGSYARVVERLRPGALDQGEIVDQDGNVLGTHNGIINYTVGQRRGIGVGGQADPLFVIRLDASTKRVIVGPYDALRTETIHLHEVNWLDVTPMDVPQKVMVKIRSTRPPVAATITLHAGARATVVLVEAEHGVSGGQACVAYSGSRVLGGGWIRTF